MKTKRVNLPNNPKDQDEIDAYLTGIYNHNGRFTNLQGVYENTRKAEESEEYKTDPKFRDAVTAAQPNEAWSFFLFLAMGVKEAAYYLAASFIEGIGTVKNEFLAYLSMAIGVKLGDKKSIALLGGDPIDADTQKLAEQCVAQIRKNAVGNKKITYEQAIGRGKEVDQILIDNFTPTFEDNISPSAIKGCAKYIELIDIGGAYTSRFASSMYPLEQVDETAMTGRDAEGSSCCVC